MDSTDIDKEPLQTELISTRDRWENLNKTVSFKLEKVGGFLEKLNDFNEQLKHLGNLVQRNEDLFATIDKVHGAAKDPKSLEKIKTLKEDNNELKRNFQDLKSLVENIVSETRPVGYNSDNLYAELERLSDRILTLQSRLDDRFNDLETAANSTAIFNEKIVNIGLDMAALENQVDALSPPAREMKLVNAQLEEATNLLYKIEDLNHRVEEIESYGDKMIDSGYVSRPSEIHEQIDQIRRKKSRLETRTRDHLEAVQKAMKLLKKFYEDYEVVFSEISQTDYDLKQIKSIGSDANQIRAQQQEFHTFRKQNIDPLDRRVETINDLGQDLIRSAQDVVSTTTLEKDLEKLNEKWNEIKERTADRDRKLDFALLQSGKFQDALKGMINWLNDSEEMMNNQKPPSVDQKVVKAQLQEQKFLCKMIGDNQNSISSLIQLGEEVAVGCEPSEKYSIETQLKDLTRRYDDLNAKAKSRTKALENAAELAKMLQDQLQPLTSFLDKSEKTLKSLQNIPTDEDKIQKFINDHDRLHHDILAKTPDVNNLVALKNDIRKHFEPEEAAIANEKIDGVQERYRNLKDASEDLGKLLNKSKQEMRQLVLSYQDLMAWFEKQDKQLALLKNISVHVDVINEQIDKLHDIGNEARGKGHIVDSTIDTGLELIKHIAQDEALQLKDKLDILRRRYDDIGHKTAAYLKNAKEGLGLAMEFHEAHTRLVNWMQTAEGILVNSAATEFEINSLEHDLGRMRGDLEAINSLGPQLAQLASDEGSSTVEGLITRDNRRFDAIVEQIQRKTERLQMIQQRSREITSDLNELVEWFRETEVNLKDAQKPSIQPKFVRQQLQEHRTLNDNISGQKGRVREVTSSAKKLVRELQSNDNMNAIRERLEDLKDVVDSVSNLSAERLSILEQASPLSEHFAETNEDLSKWLDEIEREVSLLTAPSCRADQIMQQQDKNERIMQTVSNHKPLMDKFNKTGEAFCLLVSNHDCGTLNDIIDTVNGRYNALKAELRNRQLALEHALQETSQFAEKLENMLRTLTNTSDQIKHAEPPAAHPPKLSYLIDENFAVVEDLEKREVTYVAIKQAANEIIAKASSHSDPAVREIKAKLEKLNVLWVDVQSDAKNRDTSLNDTLAVAEKFWAELKQVMQKLRDLKDTLTSQEPPATEPKAIQQQQIELQEIRHEIDDTKPSVENIRRSGSSLMAMVGDSDKPEIKKHIEDLDIAWGNITSLYAQREGNLIDAMEKSMKFHENLQNLIDFLEEAEEKVRNWKPIGADISLVKRQIVEHNSFKDRVDPHGVEIEALNR